MFEFFCNCLKLKKHLFLNQYHEMVHMLGLSARIRWFFYFIFCGVNPPDVVHPFVRQWPWGKTLLLSLLWEYCLDKPYTCWRFADLSANNEIRRLQTNDSSVNDVQTNDSVHCGTQTNDSGTWKKKGHLYLPLQKLRVSQSLLRRDEWCHVSKKSTPLLARILLPMEQTKNSLLDDIK